MKRAVGFITAGHRSEASLERYVNAVEAARERIGPEAPIIDYVGPWFDHPLFIEAIADRVKTVLPLIPIGTRSQASWFFTAHSIPRAMAKESTYVEELRKTADLVLQRLGQATGQLAYSSRSGNPQDLWLEPDVCDAIRQEAAKGVKDVLFVPIGFVADHVEILFDLDIEAKEAAEEVKVNLVRSQSVGDHPAFIQMIAEVVRKRMAAPESAEQRDSSAAS
jgi:protoporphyrin/coproporphyrin ferrochelatase